jgi:hypothetical protein
MFKELHVIKSKLEPMMVLDVKLAHHTLVPSKVELFAKQTTVLQIQL